MNQQLQHQEIHREAINKKIVLIAESLAHPENFGGMIRTAEAFGVEKIIFISEDYQLLTPKMKRLSRSAEKYIQIEFQSTINPIIEELIRVGFELVALEYTNQSLPIQAYKTSKKNIAIICGNENYGVSAEILSQVHNTIKIPVYGTTSSLNVVVATGIALNHIRAL